ncbi:MAG TPA: cobalamin-dependent protein [Syntrophorhabdaceae bacterium]
MIETEGLSRPSIYSYASRGIGIILFAVKVLLLQPPIEDFYDTSIRTYPLSLLYLAARIRDKAETAVLDLRSNRKAQRLQTHPFEDLTPFYQEGIRTPFSFFGAYYRFGLNAHEIEEEIRKADPDVVCISSLFTTYSLEALEIARITKGIKEEIVTIMGGLHPTLFPRHCLSSPYVDYVIRGEGETPLVRLIEALAAGRRPHARDIDGLCERDGDDYRISEPSVEEDIDLLPARDLLDPSAYRIGKKNYTFFLTSRGCPFQCAFCGKPAVPYRRRSLESMEREIGECLDLDIKAIDFEDDMLNLDTGFFHEVLGLFEGTGLTLSAMNGIYTGNLTGATLETMYSAGFRRLNFALVDISKPVMKNQGRTFPANFLTLLPYIEASPFLMEAHFIIGLPGQTSAEVLETMIFLMGKRLLAGPSIFYLAPGSPIFKEKVGDNWEGLIKSMRSAAMVPVNPLMPRETLFTFMKLTRFINLVKGALDREPAPADLSDLVRSGGSGRNPVNGEIIAALWRENRFLAYDLKTKKLIQEPQDRDLVRLFFEKARGRKIKGFKTSNTLVIG